MVTISLVVNTRNEANNLNDLIDSAVGVDEVIVADMESTDRTTEIARLRGAIVLNLPNAGCCEPGRQPAIDGATSDWILVLDADERLPPGAVERLRFLAGTAAPDVSAFSFAFHVFVGSTRLLQTGWDVISERHPRLFRRGSVTWPLAVHHGPNVQGRIINIPEDDISITHYNFLNIAQAIEKVNRYSSIEANELLSSGRAPAALSGIREGLDEVIRRYSPVEDGALSLTMSLAIFLYRVLVHAKAAEALGWQRELVPQREAFCRGLEALWKELSAETISASPAGSSKE